MMWSWRQRLEEYGHKFRKCAQPLETERNKEWILQGNREGWGDTELLTRWGQTSILQNYERRNCYYFKLPSCGHLLWQLQESNILFLFAIQLPLKFLFFFPFPSKHTLYGKMEASEIEKQILLEYIPYKFLVTPHLPLKTCNSGQEQRRNFFKTKS